MKPWPVTEAQTGIWLGQAKSLTNNRYNTAEFIELNVVLEAEKWLHAASMVLCNTTALNVRFFEHAGRLMQQPLPQTLRIKNTGEYLDLAKTSEPSKEAKAYLQQWYRADFDLEKGHLYRHVLIKLATNRYYWALSAHHIALDGYSFSLVTNRVLSAYEGEVSSSDKTQYLDAIEEEQQYQSSASFELDKQFWLKKLKHHPNAATLRVEGASISDEKIKVTAEICSELLDKLNHRAQKHGATWTELVFSAVACLIFAETGVKRTILGLPVANRLGTKAANTPCMYMNIVPVCIRFDACRTFTELLQQVSNELRQSRRHFRFRYERLAQADRVPSRLFGPVVNILPFERHASCDGEPVYCNTLSAGPVDDLAFVFIKGADGRVRIELEGQQSGYTYEQLQRWRSDLEALLTQFSHALDIPMQCKNKALAIYSHPLQSSAMQSPCDVISQFYEQVAATPNSTALVTVAGQQLTYVELQRQVNVLAHIIREHSLQGETVLIALPRSPNTIIAMLAVLAAGHRFVFIDASAPMERNKRIVDDASPALALVDESTQQLVVEYERTLTCIHVVKATKTSKYNVGASKGIDPHGEAYLIYTSGSTGTPKGVQISHHALVGFIDGARAAYKISAQDKVLQFAPFHFDACIEEVFLTLTTGATLVLRDDAMLASFNDFIIEIKRLAITVLDLPTAYWHELCHFLCEHNIHDLGAVHTIIIGGEAVNRQRITAWRQQFGAQIRILNTYGPTEATVVATAIDLTQSDATDLIGLPLPGRGVVVMREPEQVANFGERGELYLVGAGLASGYLRQPALTQRAFVEFWNPWSRETQRAYRTGDIVCMQSDGQLQYLGREDAQLKLSGYRIELGEIEAVLLSFGPVKEAAVTVIKDAQGEPKALAAHLVSRIEWTLEELRTQLSIELPAPMLPVQVQYYDSLPKTAANKLDRKSLNLYIGEKQTNAELNEFEQSVAQIWKDVLGLPVIQREDNFFSIGGQSLQCIQVAGRLSSLLMHTIHVAFLFAHPKFDDLCHALQGQAAQSASQSANWQDAMEQDIAAFRASLAQISDAPVSKTHKKVVFLTGATGFVGTHLLHELLCQNDLQILCHVRASSMQEAQQRLQRAYLEQHLHPLDLAKVDILLGDLSKPYFGLTNEVYQTLGARVTHLIHNAAHTSVLRDYASLKEANVHATAQLLIFAKRFLVAFNQVSTIAVAPTGNEPLTECFIASHEGLHDGYQRTKWVAERLVELASEVGVQTQVYRLARVIGAKSSGYINRNDLVWRILRTGLKLRALPSLSVAEPWTPVDIVARFIAFQTLNGQSNQVFNVTPDNQVELPELYQWLREYGFEFTTPSVKEWVDLASKSSDENDLAIASFFQGQSSTNGKNITLSADNTAFNQAATSFDVTFSPFQSCDLIPYLGFAFEQQLICVNAHHHVARALSLTNHAQCNEEVL
ncbi:Long-chain-fatty-acid--CoA ligase [Pseudoalteromonas luteoviolacea B = ATCC 29581]|nr:Long-chain-fatty-acid--CoA ligase [Pseudoalteromonas luteoviolacea B = ATCC 29581]